MDEPGHTPANAKLLLPPRQSRGNSHFGLENDDLLRRKIDPLDRRSVLAMRTTAGDAFLRELKQIMADVAKAAEQPE